MDLVERDGGADVVVHDLTEVNPPGKGVFEHNLAPLNFLSFLLAASANPKQGGCRNRKFYFRKATVARDTDAAFHETVDIHRPARFADLHADGHRSIQDIRITVTGKERFPGLQAELGCALGQPVYRYDKGFIHKPDSRIRDAKVGIFFRITRKNYLFFLGSI